MPKQKILIVEDEAVVARHLEQSLSDRGYEVAVANTGEKAVQYAAESLPDLVLVDIVLPGTVDGIKAAEQFVRSNVPVIYMTGHAESDLFDRARHTEPLAYLSKPLRMGELTRAIDLALFKRGRDVERELQTRQQAGALRASEERFRRLVEGVADYAIFTLDVSGRVNSWNAGAERITGYWRDEAIGKHFDVFFTEEDRAHKAPDRELETARVSGSSDDTRWLVRQNGVRYWAEGALTAIRDENGATTGFLKITRDATERRMLEEAVREREERLRIALDAAKTGTWLWDLRTNRDIIDESLERLFGLKPGQKVQVVEDFYALVHPADRARVIESFQRTLHEGIHLETEFRVVWPDGSEHWLLDKGEVRHDENGRPIFLTGACVDVTERRKASDALRESENRFRFYASNVRDYALLQLDPEGLIVNWNSGAERVLGYTETEVLGRFHGMLFTPEDRAAGEPQKELQEAARTGRSADERWHLRKDGNRFWASGVLTSIVDDQGRLQGFAKVMRDETERRRSEEELRASLHEKEVLLQEIHHRVKNNLQVITSLLRLQSEHIPDEQTLVLFEEARNRVQAIGGIHELLYQSPDLASVDFQLYLSRLTNDLLTFYGFENHRLRLSLHVANAKLDIGQAVPCGLIVNELVTNALKHAFPPGRSGTLSVSLDCSDGVCSLAVADDGVGLPEGFDWTAGHSLGLQLVRVLTTQLNGTARLERLHPGISFHISFPMTTGEPAIQGLPPQVYPPRHT